MLDQSRDKAAGEIKASLEGAEFSGAPVRGPQGQLAVCNTLIAAAERLNH